MALAGGIVILALVLAAVFAPAIGGVSREFLFGIEPVNGRDPARNVFDDPQPRHGLSPDGDLSRERTPP